MIRNPIIGEKVRIVDKTIRAIEQLKDGKIVNFYDDDQGDTGTIARVGRYWVDVSMDAPNFGTISFTRKELERTP